MTDREKKLAFDIQELDRKRIAREIHDVPLQNLTHVVHNLELASLYMDKDIVQAKLEIASITKNINDTIQEIRDIIYDLRPMIFDDLGLREAIERHLARIKEISDMVILSEIDEIDLNKSDSLTIFRIIQESVNNACKHSQGRNLKVLLKNNPEYIEIYVEDDGVGFDLEQYKISNRNFGLIVLKDRVESISGKMRITSLPGIGTKVHVIILKKKG
ncbi:sensor histidine kinase [Lachnospiraceae bacterium JLR.KK008]